MRPIVNKQSVVRYPLNHVLGTEARVRILRQLSLAECRLDLSVLRERVGLSRTGFDRSLASLVETGIVSQSCRFLVELRIGHPLVPPIRAVFAAERAESG